MYFYAAKTLENFFILAIMHAFLPTLLVFIEVTLVQDRRTDLKNANEDD